MSAESTALTGALGAVLGYLGSEAVEVVTFERMLWPQRFYQHWDLSVAAKQCLLFTVGGPVHRAALEALDIFRRRKLYLGIGRGHMLGTAFYTDRNVTYTMSEPPPEHSPVAPAGQTHTPRPEIEKQARNAFWVQVSRELSSSQRGLVTKDDPEHGRRPGQRALFVVHHLTLSVDALAADGQGAAGGDGQTTGEKSRLDSQGGRVVAVSESRTPWGVPLGILCSETVSVGVAVAMALRSNWAMFAYMLIPLCLKYAALVANPRRTGLEPAAKLFPRGSRPRPRMFNVTDPDQDSLVIEGSPPVVQQFFRHYGHPIRDTMLDRRREVACMVIIYAFIVYFPAGLIAIVFMDSGTQYIWLGYQLYAIASAHLTRLVGWQGCARTEARVARILGGGDRVRLEWPGGEPVTASLESHVEVNAAAAAARVRDILST